MLTINSLRNFYYVPDVTNFYCLTKTWILERDLF